MTEPPEVVCATCGTSGPVTKRFCTTCGTPRPIPAAPAEHMHTVPRPAAASPTCARCGTARVPGKRFCSRCGNAYDVASAEPTLPAPPPVAPVVPSQPVPAAPLPSPGGRRRRRGLLVALCALLALAGAGAGGYLALADDDAPADAGAPAGDRGRDRDPDPSSTDAGSDGSEEPAATVTVSTTPSASAEPTAPALRARCWDDEPAATLADCTDPQGPDGLRYVFAGFDFVGESCDTSGVREAAKSRTLYECDDEGEVRFNFSEFDSPAAGERYYSDTAGTSGTPARGDLLQWTFYNGSEHKGALLYDGGRWGVTVYSADETLRDRTLSNLARRMVAAERLRGREAG